MSKPLNNSGVAFIVAIGLIAFVGIIAIAFALKMRFEMRSTVNFQNSLGARYLAEAGINHAKQVLKKDKDANNLDALTDEWRSIFSGSDTDVDQDKTNDAKWIEVYDNAGRLFGRYAVLVNDEAGKLNLNTSGSSSNQGVSTYEVSLETLLSKLGLSGAHQMAQGVINLRYGPDEKPGIANKDDNLNNNIFENDGLDNNANGVVDEADEGIDEPQEFLPFYCLGDDRPLITLEETKLAASGWSSNFNRVNNFVTVYSKDKEITKDKNLRINLNIISPDELYDLLYTAIKEKIYPLEEDNELALDTAGQHTANIIDSIDKDCRQTVLIKEGRTYYGVEAIRINEIMVKPKLPQISLAAGGDWEESGSFIKSDVSGARDDATQFTISQPGHYKVLVWSYDDSEDRSFSVLFNGNYCGKAGNHNLNSWAFDDLGSYNFATAGNYIVTLAKADNDIEARAGYIVLTQEPDLEFIELVNLSPKDIKISEDSANPWIVEVAGGDAIIPSATIKAKDYLVLAIDADDSNDASRNVNVGNNHIYLKGSWSDINLSKCVELKLTSSIITPDGFLPDSSSTITIFSGYTKDINHIVDRVKYAGADYQKSLIKIDPAHVHFSETDFINDYWQSPKNSASPGEINFDPAEVGHSLDEINVKNNPFICAAEISTVSKSLSETESDTEKWLKIPPEEISPLVDKLTTSLTILYAKDHLTNASQWQLEIRSSPYVDRYKCTAALDIGEWQWGEADGIENGIFHLRIYGEENEALSISYRLKDGSWTNFSPSVLPGRDGGVDSGLIEIGTDSASAAPAKTLDIKVRNDSFSDVAHFEGLMLSPQANVFGRVNINTATKEVLESLPGVNSAVAEQIIANRNNGYQEIGELINLLGIDVFSGLNNLITTRSDVFEIISVGQVLQNQEVISEKKIRTIIER